MGGVHLRRSFVSDEACCVGTSSAVLLVVLSLGGGAQFKCCVYKLLTLPLIKFYNLEHKKEYCLLKFYYVSALSI